MPAMPAKPTPHDTTSTSRTKLMNTTTKKAARRSLRAAPLARDPSENVRASQLMTIAAQEVAWFYTSYDSSPEAQRARAMIEYWLGGLDPRERRSLALRYDVSPWPDDLEDAGLESGFAFTVNLVSTASWHAKSGPRTASHRRAGEQISALVREKGVGAIRAITRRAEWDFDDAVRAYASARGRAPSALSSLRRSA
jgi:hypothetical protein